MLRLNVSSKLEKVLNGTSAVATIIVALLGGLLNFKPEEYARWETFQAFLVKVQTHTVWLIPLLAVVAAVSQVIKSRIGSSNTWRTIQYLLDQYKAALFESRSALQDDPEHFHRVTLYKHVWWRWAFCTWPWTGWMVPVARTGHTTHSWKIPRFRAPADEPDLAEGVAGQAWAQKRAVPVVNLPEITPASLPTAWRQYADRGFVTQEWLEKRKSKTNALSLLGIPIEVNGNVWGALVVDSRSPDPISHKKAWNSQPFKTLTEVLSKLLES